MLTLLNVMLYNSVRNAYYLVDGITLILNIDTSHEKRSVKSVPIVLPPSIKCPVPNYRMHT